MPPQAKKELPKDPKQAINNDQTQPPNYITVLIPTLVLIFSLIFYLNTDQINQKTSIEPIILPPTPESLIFPQKQDSKLPSEYYKTFRNDHPSHFERQYELIGNIPKEKWDPSRSVQEELLHSTTPRVLTNTFITNWDAFASTDPSKKWDLNSLEWRNRIAKQISGIYLGETPYIGPLYRSGRQLTKSHPGIKDYNPYTTKKYSVDEFFDKVINSGNRTDSIEPESFLYYTGGLNTPNLSSDLHPFDQFLPTQRSVSVNVWVGEKGVVTHSHIDSYENFFVQVQGSKRFILCSPDQLHNAYLYPYFHPSFGQTQAFLVNPPNKEYQLERFPNVGKIKAYEVILNPGDLLYLPPSWIHQVYTLEPSISVNFWSGSDSTAYFDNAMKLASTNILHEWSLPQRRLAAGLLINMVLNNYSVRKNMKVWQNEEDYDPYFLKARFETFQKEIGGGDGKSNEENAFEHFVLKNTPLGENFQNRLQIDEYTKKFFELHLDSRYANGFKGDIYNSNKPIYSLFPYQDLTKRSSSTLPAQPIEGWDFFTPPPRQVGLSKRCQFAADLVLPDMTPEKYLKSYQGGGMLSKPEYKQFTNDIDVPYPNTAYVSMIFHNSILISNEFSKIPGPERANLIANFIESLAKWADLNDAGFLPSLMYCFKHAQIKIQ
jgi:hypothetical protein